MKQVMAAMCCACVLGVAGVSAQDKMDKKMDNMKSMTVTGCVAEKDGKYMLNNGMMAGDKKATTYDLMGGDLKAHVGHKVEVTGSEDSKMGKMNKDKMSKDKMMDKDKMAMPEMHTTLHVKSVKMIAATCQ
jgi:hypothetical protein